MKPKVQTKAMKKPNNVRLSFGFFMIVGALLTWSVVSAIISTTEFQNNHLANFIRVFIVVGVFAIIFSHKYLMGVGILIFILFTLFTFAGFNSLRGDYSFHDFLSFGLPLLPDEPGLATRFAHTLSMTFRYIIGIERHSLLFESVTVWTIILAVSLLIVIFCYYRFCFWILIVGTAIAFAIIISSPYFSHDWSFLIYIFCVLVLLTKRLHQHSVDSSTKGTSPFSKYIMPAIAICLIPALFIPTPQANLIADGIISRSFNVVNDMFYNLTRQRSFSLQQVGFSGEGGRLGGAVTLNHQLFMRIRIDDGNPDYQMPIYITGATFDIYTGYSWENEFADFSPVDYSTIYNNMELFEQATEIGTVQTTWLNEFINNVAMQDGFINNVLIDDRYFEITSKESLEMYYTQMSQAIQNEFASGNIDEETLAELNIQLLLAMNSMEMELEMSGQASAFSLGTRDIRFTTPSQVIDQNVHFLIRGIQHGERTVIEQTEDGHIYRMSTHMEAHSGDSNIVTWHAMASYTTLEIDVLSSRPTSIFHTGIVRDVYVQNAEVIFLRDRDGRFQGASALPRQTRYTIAYSTPNDFTSFYFDFDRDVLMQTSSPRPVFSYPGILRDNLRPFDTVNNQLGHDFLIVNLMVGDLEICFEELLSNYLIPRAERIHRIYTYLPEEFPDRVASLAYTITADATNNYERMRLLEEYLSQNYSYTLSTVRPPDDMDFVEHFLFETGEGYCVYFATAFVTMARSLGVPARYVEGFLVRGAPNNNGFIDVFNSMGHAWPEVYFEGHGWLRFEPTPTSGLPQFRELPQGGAPDNNQIPDWANEFDNMHNGAGTTPTAPINGDTPQSDGEVEAQAFSTLLFVLLALGLIFVMIIARIIFLQGKMMPRRRWHPAAAIHFYRITLDYLKHFDLEIDEKETIFQFTDRVCRDSQLFSDDRNGIDIKDFRNAASIFTKARYSNEDISKNEVILVRKVSQNLDAKLKNQIGTWKYLLHRYIIGLHRSSS